MVTLRVLIADDEKIEREALAYIIAEGLADECVIVGAAATGTEALALCLAERPDMAFLDIRMPEMDGLTVVEQLRAAGLTTRIVLASAYEDFGYAQRAIRLGVTDYLLKPVRPSEVVEQIRRAMERRPDRIYAERAALLVADLLSPQPERSSLWLEEALALGFSEVPDRAAFLLSTGDAPVSLSSRFTGLTFSQADGLGLLLSAQMPLPDSTDYPLGIGTGTEVGKNMAASLEEARLAAHHARAKRIRGPVHYGRLSESAVLVARALTLVHGEYAAVDLSMAGVAHRFGMSATHFSRIFSREVEQGFASYLTGVRIRSAERLLRETSWPIERVTRWVGFASHHYFCAVFKRENGLSPGEYRTRWVAGSGGVQP
jgi:two-component system response regulator YesN